MFSLRDFLLPLLATALVLGPIAGARAECSDNRVMRLTRNGNSPGKIALTCKMEVEEIKEIIEDGANKEAAADVESKKNSETVEAPPAAKGLPENEQLGPCGCWGPDGFQKRPFSKCASGYAQARICGPICPQGGFAWYGECTQ